MEAPLKAEARPVEKGRRRRLGQSRIALLLSFFALLVLALGFPYTPSPFAAVGLVFAVAFGIGGVLGMLAPAAIEGNRVYRDGFRLRALLDGDLGWFGAEDIERAYIARHEWGESSRRALLTVKARDGSTATFQGGIEMDATEMEVLRREFRDTYIDEVVGPEQAMARVTAWLAAHGVEVEDRDAEPGKSRTTPPSSP